MRAGQADSARRAPYDRSLTFFIPANYNQAGIGPHGATTRQTYTVGTNAHGILSSADCNAIRTTVATTVGKAQIVVSNANLSILHLAQFIANAVGNQSALALAGQTDIQPGDTINLITADSSTGGAVDYTGAFVLESFSL